MALGSIFGYWLSATINVQGNRRTFLMFASMFLFSCCLMLLSQVESPKIALFGLFMAGGNLQAMTLFQKNTPTELRGRVMSLLMTISSGLLPLGLLIGGVLGTLTNNNTQLIFGLCSFSIGLLTIFTSFNLNIRNYMFNSESTRLNKAYKGFQVGQITVGFLFVPHLF
jgi:MFS family permease